MTVVSPSDKYTEQTLLSGLTTADLPPTTDKRYVTDAELVVLGNTSNSNTGDQTLAGLGGVATTDPRLSSRVDALMTVRGFISQTSDFRQLNNSVATASGTLRGSSLWLHAGEVVTNLWQSVWTAAAGTNPTHIWLGLYSLGATSSPFIATTADLAADTQWTSVGKHLFPLTSPYTAPTTGAYLPVFLQVGSWGTTAMRLGVQQSAGGAQGNNPTGSPLSVSKSGLSTLPDPLTSYSDTEGTYFWFGVS